MAPDDPDMNGTATDDKIEGVVRLVLQAVDQRLSAMRDQLNQITDRIASNHPELPRRMEECQKKRAGVRAVAMPAPAGNVAPAPPASPVSVPDAPPTELTPFQPRLD